MGKRIRNILLIGVLFGGALLILEIVFQLPEEVVWRCYIIASAVIIVGALAINIVWQMKFIKKLKSLVKILNDEKNPDKFIEENKKLLQTVKSYYNRAIININISAGYCDKGNYEEAKEILLSIPSGKLKGINKVIYNINLASAYFRLEENLKALDILERYNKEFLNLEKLSALGGSIANLRIFQHLAKNEISQAEDLLILSKEKWQDNRLLEDWEFLQTKIDKLKLN